MKKKYYLLLIGGIIALLIGMLLKLNVLPLESIKSIPIVEIICTVFVEGLIAFGSGLIVAYFGTIIKVSDKISEMLSKSGKEKIINETIGFEEQLSDYKQKRIKDIISLNEEYRTNTVYHAFAYVKDNQVVVETILSYTVYLPEKEIEPIKVRFDTDTSVVNYIKITNPQNSNDSITFEEKDLSYTQTGAHGDGLIYEWSCDIPKRFKKCKCVNIEKKYTIYGEDHWVNYGIIFQHITEGLSFMLTLSQGLTIKETTICEKPNVFSVKYTPKGIIFRAEQYLSRYGGFSIIITK